MIARELPPDEVLASWQHVDQRAHDLRAAGMPGSLRELRIQAYLDLLQERDSRLAPCGPGTGQASHSAGPGGDDDPGGGGPAGTNGEPPDPDPPLGSSRPTDAGSPSGPDAPPGTAAGTTWPGCGSG